MATMCGWLATLLATACAVAESSEPIGARAVSEKADRILVVSDSPNYYSTRDLKRLYPGLVDEHNVADKPITAKHLAPYRKVWTLTRRAEKPERLDYSVIREHAARTGARVVSHLFEYAHGSGLEFRLRNAGNKRHKLRIVATSDPATRGYAVGDEVYWYRNTNDVDEPPVGHYTYREVICEDDPQSGRKVLARSTMTGGAMWIEERFESGGIILAYDLFSPLDLCLTQGDPWVLHRGTFSKYVPAGNLFGGTVRYGRYVNRKLTVEEVLVRIRKLAERPNVEVRNEGPSSEMTPILSVRFGNPDGPQFLLIAGKHGSEWENVYGMLITIEQLLDGGVIDLEEFCVVVVPMLNPYGYRNGTRLNANGVDLNRQLRTNWETFRGWTDEVIEPWTFDFKGTARGGEPEAKIESRLLAQPNLIGVVDAHAMTGGPVLGGAGPDAEVVRAIAREIVANLKSRYLIRYLTDAAPRQLTLETHPAQTQTDDASSPFKRTVDRAPAYHLYYENVGQLPDVHATVMQTDLATEINLTILRHIAQSLKE